MVRRNLLGIQEEVIRLDFDTLYINRSADFGAAGRFFYACLCFIPTLGMKRSHLGNKMFPAWEYNVPLLGTNYEPFRADCDWFIV